MKVKHLSLTRHPEGSISELLTISCPLMLSMLSTNLMLFLDRLFLAHYNIQAMNSVVTASVIASIFLDGVIGIAAITEIFVGQYNGARHFKRVGTPVWQMLWYCVFTILIFLPLSFFGAPFLLRADVHYEHGQDFFKILMYFGPLYPMVTVLSAFFIGRGKVKFAMVVALAGNILNISLDYIFISGIPGLLPALGATGAALATGISQTFQVIVLFCSFLNTEHRKVFGTANWHFKKSLFFKCFTVGLPNSFSNIIELIAWSVLADMLATVSQDHITVYSIVQSFLLLFTFGVSGLQKGLMNLHANFLGGGNLQATKQSLYSSKKVVMLLIGIFAIPLLILPDYLISLFINTSSDPMNQFELAKSIKQALFWLWLYFLFDGFGWLFSSVLIAAGDTKFLMLMNVTSAWIYSIVPTYIVIVLFQGSPTMVWEISLLYAGGNTLCYYWRYKSNRWKKNTLRVA